MMFLPVEMNCSSQAAENTKANSKKKPAVRKGQD